MDPVVQQHPNHAHLSENYGQERRLSTKLELPDIDYGTIRNRSRLQLVSTLASTRTVNVAMAKYEVVE